MSLAFAGLLVSSGTAAWAGWLALRGSSNAYAGDLYGMTRATHARYAVTALAVAVFCAAACARPQLPGTVGLGAALFLAVFYFTSFLRGFSDE